MEKKLLILIYEKEKNLNIILKEQFSKLEKYDTFITSDQEKLLNLIYTINFDVCIINLEDLSMSISDFIKIFQSTYKHRNIIGYYERDDDSFLINENEITLLKKPFRLITLFGHLDNLKKLRNTTTNKYLMSHLEFIPIKKIITNLNTKNKEHITEKETNLLNFLYNKKNIDIPKMDLLGNIWGVTEDINTHTLETHIYRLKQKLYKLEPNLSFSLINQNGFYSLKYNI